jgi:hypothetical protein
VLVDVPAFAGSDFGFSERASRFVLASFAPSRDTRRSGDEAVGGSDMSDEFGEVEDEVDDRTSSSVGCNGIDGADNQWMPR